MLEYLFKLLLVVSEGSRGRLSIEYLITPAVPANEGKVLSNLIEERGECREVALRLARLDVLRFGNACQNLQELVTYELG